MNKRNMYTLVELIVTIAVIIILASMLITAMEVAKTKEKTISCSERQRAIYGAFMEHQSEFGYLPAPADDINNGGKYTT